MSRHTMAALVCVALFTSVLSASELVINEVFYDPEGSDTGLEFIEIMNCGHATIAVSEWTLETGNGAHPDDWTVEWIGGPLDEIEPGGILLIGERDVEPHPDVVTPLDLQNGPDGCRLTDGDRVVDCVGWGEPLFSEYCEGAPAGDVSSGLALARMPDCLDTDDNAVDFVGRIPTPGARNTVTRDLAVAVRHARRVVHPDGEPMPVDVVVRNLGAESVDAGGYEVSLICDGSSVAAHTSDCLLAPRDSCDVRLVWSDPSPGYHHVDVSVVTDSDGLPSNNVASTTATVGAPAGLLVVNEIMHSPGGESTEWVELVATAGESVDLRGWSLGDDADEHTLLARDEPQGRLSLEPGAFLVVAREPELVDAGGAPTLETDGWEALSSEDVVVLLDAYGTPIDRVAYERGWGGDRDVSLEKARPDLDAGSPASWGSSVAPAGSTPGLPNSILIESLPVGGTLTVSPNPFTPDGDGRNDRTVVSCELPTATALARLSVYDIRGRLRGRLLDHEQVASRHEVVWDGLTADGPLPPGLYVLYLEAIDARAGVLSRAKALVGIAR
ncbi:MAG: hypothetical protein GF405_10980 [Candidatus Eisenbacteria bacterium]|nr:hypothetical protein [Candidatus Eisenbacteria bacterium]